VAVIGGYAIIGIPVFGTKKTEYLAQIKHNSSIIAQDYVKNSALLISLSKAVGRLIISY